MWTGNAESTQQVGQHLLDKGMAKHLIKLQQSLLVKILPVLLGKEFQDLDRVTTKSEWWETLWGGECVGGGYPIKLLPLFFLSSRGWVWEMQVDRSNGQ